MHPFRIRVDPVTYQRRMRLLVSLALVPAAIGLLGGLQAPPMARLGVPVVPMFIVCTLLYAACGWWRLMRDGVHGQTLVVSFSAFPLVLGVCTLPTPWLMIAAVLGMGTSQWLRAMEPGKNACNLALSVLEVGVATWVIATVQQLAPQVPPWLVPFAGVAVVDLMSVGLSLFAVRLLQGQPSSREAVRWMTLAVLTAGAICTSLATLVLVGLRDEQVAGFGLMVIVSLAITIAFATHARLIRAALDRGALLRATRAMSRATSPDALLGELARHAGMLVRAEQIHFWPLASADARAAHPSASESAPGPRTVDMPGGGFVPMVISKRRQSAEQSRWLARIGARDALIVPLPTSEWHFLPEPGTLQWSARDEPQRGQDHALVALDRWGQSRTFDKANLQLLQTLVAHALAVAENRRLAARLLHEASHDPLTGLPNRAAFLREVAQALQDRAASTQVAVIILALGRFKAINDSVGHETGDAVLRVVAQRLAALAPPHARVSRFGGDEFAVLLSDAASSEDAMAAARRLVLALSAPIELEGGEFDVSATGGVALATDAQISAATLVRHADIARTSARSRGQTLAWYSAMDEQRSAERLALARSLRHAVAGDAIKVVFQPQIRVRDRRVVGFEALARWSDAQHGPVDPWRFIRLAERTGQLPGLTRIVLRQAVQACAAWPEALTVSVNMPARLLRDPDLPEQLSALLSQHNVAPGRLVLELTEDSLMDLRHEGLQPLERLRQLGVRLSIDDFGTGYSAFAYLRSIPAQEIKIDRSFMLNAGHSVASSALIESIVRIAHVLDLQAVAEGVDDDATLQALEAMGCDVVQGFRLARPMAAASVPGWLASWAHGAARLQHGQWPTVLEPVEELGRAETDGAGTTR